MGLLEMSVSGAVLIAVTALIRAAAVNLLPKRTFLALWAVALLRLTVPVQIPSVYSVYSNIPRRIAEADSGFYKTGHEKQAEKNALREKGFLLQPSVAENKSEGTNEKISAVSKNMQMLKLVWVCGSILFLFLFAAAYIKCRISFSASAVVKNVSLPSWLKAQNGRRSIQIRQSCAVKAPLTYGLLHPVILMPEHTDWNNTKQLSYVFMHEYIHIRRFDAALKCVLAIVLAVHWPNPFVWLMFVLCSRDLELSCDETVVRIFGETAKAEYAHTLITMEERKRRPMPFCSSFSKNAMEERIVAILKIRKRSAAAAVTAVVLVCVVAVLFATSGVKQRTDTQESSRAEEPVKVHRDIKNISLNLSDRQAEYLYDEVEKQLIQEYAGVYSMQNISVVFSNEVVYKDMLSLDVEALADMTLIRNPKESPFVKGMMEEIAATTDQEKKKAAQKICGEFLDEVMPYYRQPERTSFLYQVHVPLTDIYEDHKNTSYELCYRSGGEDGEWYFSTDPADDHFTEEKSMEDGRAYIKENLNET